MSKFSRDRVKGFLHTDGRKMVNENGETVVLRGWGVGSWMNPEGFMIGGVPLFAEVGGFNDFALPRRFERGRTMETTVRELAEPPTRRNLRKNGTAAISLRRTSDSWRIWVTTPSVCR